MLLKILLLSFFSSTVYCSLIPTKINIGSENFVHTSTENRGTDSMTPKEPNRDGLEESPFHDHEMLGDQPMNDDGFKTISVAPLDDAGDAKRFVGSTNARATSSADRSAILEFDKNQRLREIENLISLMIGRSNGTENGDATNTTNFDISHLPPIEKIFSFSPKCNPPKVAKDSWKEENLLHLYFNVSYNTNATLASAIIKLHRLPRNQSNTNDNGSNGSSEDDDKLLRVSIYWYSKQGKKQRLRKRLCDSKVVADKQNSVELNVKPAVTSWLDSQNLGFAIKVENQDETVLKASNYFKGDECKSGNAQSPHSIPITGDLLSNTSNEIRQRILEDIFLGSGSLPKISICTVESITGAPLAEKSISCQLHKTLYSHHHIRHQKHLEETPARLENHFKKQHLDIRSLMENQTVYVLREELDRANRDVRR